MNLPQAMPGLEPDHGDALRASFARGNALLGKISPILGHLLATPDHSMFSDEIVARVRGMLNDLAWQILRAQAEATGQAAREAFADRHGEALAAHFQTSPALLAHCHALALEWQLATRMEAVRGLDPVLSPLIQHLIASSDSAVASAAMAGLAAQARFAQGQRRMELLLTELPGDLFHEILLAWRDYNGSTQSDAIVRAEAKLRNCYDESAGRLALFARLVTGIGAQASRALMIEDAGAAIFATALAMRSGQSREMALLSSNERQMARLALGLRAAGLPTGRIEEAIFQIHPEAVPPEGIAEVEEHEAQQLLAESGRPGID